MADYQQGRNRSVKEIENLLIPLADGTRLAARVFIPDDAETSPVPVILECVPYGKRFGTWERDELLHPVYAAHGYAGVRLDLRGSGESEGLLEDEYAPQEQADCVEVIDWLSRQSWCSGAVGLMGISWGGFNALQVAARRPEALKAIITVCSTDDRFSDDVHYMGGALLQEDLLWNAALMMSVTQPPDPVLVGERWRDMWLQRLENVRLFLATWLRHPTRDAYWKHGSVAEDFAAISCPVYVIGGWTDAYTNSVTRLLSGLQVPRKGLIGPWAHRYPHMGLPGPPMGFVQDSLEWWDRWLKGIDNGAMDGPILRAWMLESVRPAPQHAERPGRWVAEPVWPPADQGELRLCLNETGLESQPGVVAPRVLCSPETTGEYGGSWCSFGPDDADDQRCDDARSLVFDSPPLEDRLEILGAPVLTVDLACDVPHATLTARLCDVHPDGASLRVSYGVLNLTHRGGHEFPAQLEPGRRYTVRIQLNDIAFAFPPGHRIRVALSTAYWPIVWPSPKRATLNLFTGNSLIALPVRGRRPEDARLAPLPPSDADSLRVLPGVYGGRGGREVARSIG
jgi:putative CocE/NonD family hydrolase